MAIDESERFPIEQRIEAVRRAHSLGSLKRWRFVTRTVIEGRKEWVRIWRVA